MPLERHPQAYRERLQSRETRCRRTPMTVPTRRAVVAGVGGLVAAAPLRFAVAQDAADAAYPTRNITLIVPFAPGGSTDILARLVGGHLQQAFGEPVGVENRTGASGNIGA